MSAPSYLERLLVTVTTISPFTRLIRGAVVAILCVSAVESHAQPTPVPAPASSVSDTAMDMPSHERMGMGDDVFGHFLFNQLEGRTNDPDNGLRWDMEAWVGSDMNKLWFKSEGFVEHGKVSDGITEALYDRPLPFLKYFDAQAGVRYDLDSDPGRLWGAIGVEGLAPYFFEFAPTLYFSDRGIAARLAGSYDLLITNRLILQPQFELNFYSEGDRRRGIGSGLSDLDTGLRLRYETSRKFAPYVGVTYAGKFGETADLTRTEGRIVDDVRFVFGIRSWY
jgi:copper resistance protein B